MHFMNKYHSMDEVAVVGDFKPNTWVYRFEYSQWRKAFLLFKFIFHFFLFRKNSLSFFYGFLSGDGDKLTVPTFDTALRFISDAKFSVIFFLKVNQPKWNASSNQSKHLQHNLGPFFSMCFGEQFGRYSLMILILSNILHNLSRFGPILKLWSRKNKEMRRENATINILLKCWLLNEEQSCILLLMLNANIDRFDLLCALRLPQIRWNGVEKSRYHFIQFQSNRIESNLIQIHFGLNCAFALICDSLTFSHAYLFAVLIVSPSALHTA